VEKSQYDLCIEILERLNNQKVLTDIILIGSWCLPFYEKHFFKQSEISPLRTRDLDFFVPDPQHVKAKTDIPERLKDLGFVEDFIGEGYMRLIHPDLFVEFLVQERGRGSSKPYPLPQLGLNAQRLRFLDLLAENTIQIKVENLRLRLPHPANFALHKLIVMHRRTKADKAEKDKTVALSILQALIKAKKGHSIKIAFQHISKKWQRKITETLKENKFEKTISFLE